MQLEAKWVSTTLLPVSAVSLGRLVGDISNPEFDYEDTFRSDERPDGPELVSTETQAKALQHDAATAESWGLSLALTAVLGSTLSVERDAVDKIDAELVTTRTLSNSTRYFGEACRLRAVRELLERRWRDRRKVFMATGVITLTNARVTLRRGNKLAGRPILKLPGSVVVLAATHGAVPTLGGLEGALDSELAVTRGNENRATSTLSFPGENIFAVQYRQVGFSWFRGPSQKTPTLKEGAQWKAYLGSRGEQSDVKSSSEDGLGEPGYREDEDEYESEEEDADFVTLRAQVGGHVESDDLGDFADYEDFRLDNDGELWHIF